MRGGTSRHVADVVRHATDAVHHVAVPPSASVVAGGAVFDSPALARMEADGAVLHRVPMSRSPLAGSNASAVAGVARLIRLVRPDVVHGHSSVGGAVARVAGAVTRVPVAYTANGVATEASYRIVERSLGPLTWRWVAVSESEAAMVRGWGLKRVVVVPNGIVVLPSPSSGLLRARLGLGPDTPLVGTVTRLVAQKAPEDFVAVCAAVAESRPEVHFVLIGMGPLQPLVSAAVAASGSVFGDRWHQIEHLPDAASALADLDVFVLASRFEGAPYTPLEAMVAGVPVVLTDVVGSRDCVVSGESGLLCPPGDIEALSAGVSSLLDSVDYRAAMGTAGRQRVRSHFDVVDMGRALSALYASAR